MTEKIKPMKKLFLHEQERFWMKVEIGNGPNACWLWRGRLTERGYGRFTYRQATYKAHRVAYFLTNGRIDNSLLVLHSCDRRVCVNPQHLFQGDAKANSQDAAQKGRNTRLYGELNGNAKLTEREVRSIRRRYKTGKVTQKSLALYHGVGETTIYYICKGTRWINLPDEINT